MMCEKVSQGVGPGTHVITTRAISLPSVGCFDLTRGRSTLFAVQGLTVTVMLFDLTITRLSGSGFWTWIVYFPDLLKSYSLLTFT